MNEELFIKKVLTLEEDVRYIKEVMVTKDELRGWMDPITGTLDYLVKITTKMDTELTFMNHRLKETWDKVEAHDRDIARIKPLVGLI
ncbi:MAG: hypothetical protein UY92_C0014G0099 [Candidatus Magasanikbacteria bacterium GW2011_GWA2_56_11]|uniref:Uncharacterized protein n=1 Tax=Candidatus Magasanikbacteria bacterium GW2011_GWA2_56_11 TaxID=1619044 RepID=A0A0G2B8K2_9BACT|nr:MAG: hypothetical protein UY92_C0014G0099 [Candidatus Magasanikbacteria bacterium GW2011_GWA2_56_11]